jgi:ribosomal protein S18 acetylase RimI-like enzyme
MKIRTYQPGDHDAVINLWRECALVVPQNDPALDIARKLDDSPDLFFVGIIDEDIIATAMAGYDGHRGAVNYLAVSPSLQGRGLGRDMMQHVEVVLKEMGCAKINLNIRRSNLKVINFYENIGFKEDDVVTLGKRLVIDEYTM